MTLSLSSVVARVAYLASDLLVDSQPTLPAKSLFSETFRKLSTSSTTHRPTVIPVPLGADPGSTLLLHLQSHPAGNLISYTATSHPETLTRLVLHLAELASLPVVLHLAVQNDDLSDVLLLRSAVPFFIVSLTAQQAHDNALLASRLARTENKAVVHVFYEDTGDVEEIEEDKIQPFLSGEKPSRKPHANGVNGHTDPPSPTDATLKGLFTAYESADLSTLALVRRSLRPLSQHGASNPHTVIFTLGKAGFSVDVEDISFVSISLLSPLPASHILKFIPSSATRVIVLEQVQRWSMKWTPLYLDVVAALQQRVPGGRPVVQSGYLSPSGSIT